MKVAVTIDGTCVTRFDFLNQLQGVLAVEPLRPAEVAQVLAEHTGKLKAAGFHSSVMMCKLRSTQQAGDATLSWTFAMVYGKYVGHGTWVNNSPGTIVVTAYAVATAQEWLAEATQETT